MKNYGEKITGYRKKVGLLQAELAEKLGVTRQAVSRWEHDVTEPDLESVKRMCRIFGITTDEFLFGEYVEYKDLRTASALDDDENALTETEATGERLPEEEEIAAAESKNGKEKTQKKKFTLFKTKRAKNIFKLALNTVIAAILIVVSIVGTNIMYLFENEIDSRLTPPIIDKEELSVASAAGQKLSARIMEEGATLLRNENNVLPLDRQQDKKVNVFGWRSVDWIYGSEGENASGGVSPEEHIDKNVDLYKALNAYGIAYNDSLRQMYIGFKQPDLQSENLRGVHVSTLTPLCEPDIDDKKYYTDELLENAKNYSDTAIVVIARMAAEGMDCSSTSQEKRGPTGETDNTRHYLEISTEEEKLLKYVGANYEKVIVLLNMANVFELGFLETIDGLDACVYLGFTGTRAMSSLPMLLYGETSFSGHTVDTFAYDLFTNPANLWTANAYTNGGGSYHDFIEGIYVGYRWYETTDSVGYWNDYKRTTLAGELTGYNAVVQYPFGYGLTYNDYSWTIKDVSVAPGSDVDENTKIDITVAVKNNGAVKGREVISAYVTVPYTKGGIEKSYVSLIGFTKTDEIAPGAEVETTLTVSAYDFRSYDCYDKDGNGFKGYEIEKGEYKVKLMTDSHTVKKVDYKGEEQDAEFSFNVKNTINLETDLVTGKTVKNLFTGEDSIDCVPIDSDSKDGSFKANIPWLTREKFLTLEQIKEKNVGREGNPVAVARKNGEYTRAMADEWDNATVDAFGEEVSQTAPAWGQKNGLKLADENGTLTALGEKLGENYDDPEWEKLLDQLTISDIIDNLINGYYSTQKIESIGKPKLNDFDGPAQFGGLTRLPGNRGTGYPTMVVVASTWNPKLAYEFGKSYGDDMKSVGGDGMWGWAVDSHRTAWFGRNHESPSEDPFLAGTIVAQAVKGLSTKGKYCTIKHFALYGNGGIDRWVTEQAFREIHLEAFRKAFVEGGALGCMTTYQGVGAEHSESTTALLTGVLRKEWAFNGAITTDYIGKNFWCESIIRSGGNLGMGVSLSKGGFSDYKTVTPTVRFQNRLRESAHQTLYMWLRAKYYEREYLKNPDKNDNYVSSTSINSWCWWKPLVTCIDVLLISGAVFLLMMTYTGVFMKDEKSSQEQLVSTERTENN